MAMDASVRASGELGGLSPVQLRALTALRRLAEANLAQLAEEMGVTVSTTSRLVDRLVSADWVHRTSSPPNRREIRLTLTESGKRLLRRYGKRRGGVCGGGVRRGAGRGEEGGALAARGLPAGADASHPPAGR